MKKRILSILLCAALALPLVPAALAEVADVPQAEKAAVLRELEVFVGDETGALHLERGVTRAEFTKLLIAASPYKDAVGESAGTDPYPDVSHRSWYAPYVRAAVDAGLVKGDERGWFHPDDAITLQEGVTMAVRLLGYQDGDFTAPWPAGQMALYRSLDLDAGVSAQSGTDLLTRQDCLHLFYDLLCAPTKQGQSYVNSLGHTLNQDGEVDVPALFRVEQEGPIPLTGDWKSLLPFDVSTALIYRDNDRSTLADLREWDLLYWAKDQAILFATSNAQGAMGQLTAAVEGPVVAEGDWKAKLPFDPAKATSVTRNGARATTGEIRTGDVVYWSKYAQSLYVYAKTVSGAVEAVSPSLAAPTSVTIAGVAYPLETLEAQYAFSDLGSYRKGDRVKLLLGRTGGVAAVRSLEQEGDQRQVGLVSALESRSYTDARDDLYASKVVVITAADGNNYTYPYPWKNNELEIGDLVEVVDAPSGVRVSHVRQKTLTAAVSADAAYVGQTPLSPDADILDTYGQQTAKSVYPSRLAGVELSGGMVRYYETDEAGTITSLILNDVTGDLHTYGVVTESQVVSIPSSPMTSMSVQGSYTLDVAGRLQTVPVSGKRFSAQTGPACLMMDGQSVKNIRNLTKLSGVTLGDGYALADDRRYPLADGVAYYIKEGAKTYTLASRSQVLDGDYALSAWYDTLPTAGGRVRVILASKY